MNIPPLNPATNTLPTDPGKFAGDKNLKYDGVVVEYFGKRYHVNITDENGVTTRLSDPAKIKRIVRMLAQANFHVNKQDLAQTIIAKSEIKVFGKPVNVYSAEKLNSLFLKVFDQVKKNNPKEEGEALTIEFLEESGVSNISTENEAFEQEKIANQNRQALEAKKKGFYTKRIDSFKNAIQELQEPVFDRLRKGELTLEEISKLEEALKNKKADIASYERYLPANIAEDTSESRELRKLIVDAGNRLEDIDKVIEVRKPQAK